MKTEAEFGVMWPGAKGRNRMSTTRRSWKRQKGFSPRASGGHPALLIPCDFKLLTSRSLREEISAAVSHPADSSLPQQPQGTNTTHRYSRAFQRKMNRHVFLRCSGILQK